MKPEYEIIETENFLSLLRKRKANYVYDIIENRAKVFLLEDKDLILIPAAGTNQVLLFKSEKDMFNVIEKEGIPLISNSRSPFKLNIDKLKRIEETYESLIYELDAEILHQVKEKNFTAASKLIRKALRKITIGRRNLCRNILKI